MSQSNREQLQQIAALIKAGKKTEATKMLVPLLKADPNNAAGWWLMANAVTDAEHKKRALNRLLQLRPDDAKAQAMLAKLEPPTTIVAPIEHDPYNDPDNPFVTAKFSSVEASPPARKSFLDVSNSDDNPFADATGDDDPFADAQPTPNRRSSLTSTAPSNRASSSTKTPAATMNSTWLIIGGAVLVAVIAIGAAAVIAATRGSPAGPTDDTYVEPEVHCADEDVEYNANEYEGSRLPSGLVDFGSIAFGETVQGDFRAAEDKHSYSFIGEAGEWVVVEMWAMDPIDLDPVVEIYDPYGRQFAFCDDISLESWDTYMEARLPRNGLYTIVARQYEVDPKSGTYRLSLERR